MAYPIRPTADPIMMNRYLILSQSENVAIIMLAPNETTQGGTEYSWVLIGEWPNDRMMEGAKYAYPSGQSTGSAA